MNKPHTPTVLVTPGIPAVKPTGGSPAVPPTFALTLTLKEAVYLHLLLGATSSAALYDTFVELRESLARLGIAQTSHGVNLQDEVLVTRALAATQKYIKEALNG